MQIEKEIKDQVKDQKLLQLKIQYATLEMDKVALESVGDTDGAKQIEERMNNIRKAYEAIDAL
jgi:hypothetical protein